MNKEEKEQTIQDLELIKTYFGENDKTAFQHMAFGVLKKHIDYLSSQSDRVEMPTKELSEITEEEFNKIMSKYFTENAVNFFNRENVKHHKEKWICIVNYFYKKGQPNWIDVSVQKPDLGDQYLIVTQDEEGY